ncbi:hypothetical protein GOBAR_DD26224 [Gossypium barbadense]|nr:hypothetical protein GOBAR_DD26224 [Gossypium barbadense]
MVASHRLANQVPQSKFQSPSQPSTASSCTNLSMEATPSRIPTEASKFNFTHPARVVKVTTSVTYLERTRNLKVHEAPTHLLDCTANTQPVVISYGTSMH